MFASEYLNQQGVKKAKGIIEMKKLLKKERENRQIGE